MKAQTQSKAPSARCPLGHEFEKASSNLGMIPRRFLWKAFSNDSYSIDEYNKKVKLGFPRVCPKCRVVFMPQIPEISRVEYELLAQNTYHHESMTSAAQGPLLCRNCTQELDEMDDDEILFHIKSQISMIRANTSESKDAWHETVFTCNHCRESLKRDKVISHLEENHNTVLS